MLNAIVFIVNGAMLGAVALVVMGYLPFEPTDKILSALIFPQLILLIWAKQCKRRTELKKT